jgi:hypothetical protein
LLARGQNRIAIFFRRPTTADKHPAIVAIGIVVENAKRPASGCARRKQLLKFIPSRNRDQTRGWGWRRWRLANLLREAW